MAVVACWIGWVFYRTSRIEGFRRDLAAKGFPADYAAKLAELKFDHTGWVFEPLPVVDMSWEEIVAKECTPSWNLVVYADWAPDEWNALKEKNYTPYYAGDAKAYDSGAWYQASREAVAYFMDPRNFLNERDIFMFETLGFDEASQSEKAVERTLSKTFMATAKCDGCRRGFAELLMDVGRSLGVSPVFLAGRLASEQGSGSAQAFGTIGDALVSYRTNATGRVGNAVIWGRRFTAENAATAAVIAKGAAAYNGYYNFFNFRAYGSGLFEIKYNAWVEATAAETREKYGGPWNTQERAIRGGALKVKERYIDTHRHTRYLQKFSVLPQAGAFRWKQYMQNIAAPLIEARNTGKAYAAAGTLDSPYRFLIPVYKLMPAAACADPAGGRSVYSSSP
ncbi:MAG: hypothetical protein J6T01_05320 [Kiritimatiellae bacterium]|nr:hypothetical protein [Kiritimatiellia bacterium]